MAIQNDGGGAGPYFGQTGGRYVPKKLPAITTPKVPAGIAKPVAPVAPGRSANSIEGRTSANNNYSGKAGTAKSWTSSGPGTPRVDTWSPGGGGDPAPLPMPEEPAIPSDDEWLNSLDSQYKVDINSLMSALKSYTDKLNLDRGNYETDFKSGLKTLGYQDKDNDLTNNYDKATGKALDGSGSWLWEDRNTSAGRGRGSVINDFAGRGALRSSDYLQAQTDLQRNLGDQLSSMFTSRERANQDWDSQLQGYKTQTGFDDKGNVVGGAAASAKNSALARKALKYTTF